MSEACAAKAYRPRDPRAPPQYRLFESHFDEVKGQWEERYEGRYGFWRGFVDEQRNMFKRMNLKQRKRVRELAPTA